MITHKQGNQFLPFSIITSSIWNTPFSSSHVLSNCTQTETGFRCTSTIESVWFKIVNATAATEFITTCDRVFYKKYGDITYDSI